MRDDVPSSEVGGVLTKSSQSLLYLVQCWYSCTVQRLLQWSCSQLWSTLSPVSGDNMIVNIVTLGNIILHPPSSSVLLHWQTFYCSQPGVVNVAGNFYEPGLMSINCVWQVWHISQMIVATGQVTGQCLIIQINWVSWCLLQCSSLSDQPLM